MSIEQTPALNERAWDAWVEKNRLQDLRRSSRRLKVVGVLSIVLMLGAGLWTFVR